MKNMKWFRRVLCLSYGLLLVAVAGCINIDIVPPTVVSTTPGDGAAGVALNATISATFSEAVKPALVNTTSFRVADAAGNVAGSVAVSGLTATFTPANPLTPNTTYTVTLTKEIKDFSGNPLSAVVSWTFTTASVLPTVAFSNATQAVDEGVGAVTVTVTLSEVAGKAVSVPFIVSGTASGGLDHDLVDGTVAIAAGSATGEVTFNVLEDGLDEPSETVILTLGTPTNAKLGAPARHTVTVSDNDPPVVNWTVNGQTANETVACPCAVTVTAALSSTSVDAVTVPYTVSGTATLGADFSAPTPDPLVIAAGNLSASLTFDILDDAQTESSEFVIITMGAPVNAVSGTTVQHSVEVLDDE